MPRKAIENHIHHTAPSIRIIAVADQKGDVSKTTTTLNLTAIIARLNHRVLVIDLDSTKMHC